MTPNQNKILIYTIGGIALVSALTYGICSIIILHNYSKIKTIQEAENTLANATKDAEPIKIEPNDNTEDVSTGSTMGNDDPDLVIDNSDN